MRKNLYVIFLAPVLLSLSCNLEMPTAVQVKGSPDFKFSADFDIGKHLEGFFKEDSFNSNNDIDLLDCVNTEVVTYIVYMKLLDDKITLTGIDINNNYTPTTEQKWYPTDNGEYAELKVPAMDFGNFLTGFSFDESKIKSKLYISGKKDPGDLSVELKIGDAASTKYKADNKATGLNVKKETYNGTDLPNGGKEIDLKLDGKETSIKYKILVQAHDTIKKEWLQDPSVLVEIAVWLPFNFTADKEGSEVNLPNDLFPEGDLFGRESPNGDKTVTDMLESLNFAMKMNKDPFTRARLSVESKGINIENPITGASLEFPIDEQNMKIINTPANIPFTPKLNIVFAKDGTLSFLRNFFITEIAFKAKFNHTIDLPGGKK